jgi:hypothetical protein
MLCWTAWGQPARFRQVEEWRGTVTVELTQKGSASMGGMTEAYDYKRSARMQVLLDRYDAQAGRWEGTVTGPAEINDTTVVQLGCGVTNVLKGSADVRLDSFGVPRKFFLVFDSDDRFYFMASDPNIVTKAEVRDCQGRVTTSYERRDEVIPAMREFSVVPPAAGVNLMGSSTVVYRNATLNGMIPAAEVVWKVSWDLKAKLADELELLLEPDSSYPTWIPQGTQTETAAGNRIGVGAKLQSKGGGAARVKARKITFTMESSREPGVAMNYPLPSAQVSPAPHDMQFEAEQNAGWRILNRGLQAEREGAGMTEGNVIVSSFDFGGWATVRATATLEDGREVSGVYRGESGMRLPKRPATSKVADAWREQTGEQGADREDADELPLGDGRPGDGLTVYEEYRGFVENAKHLRTNTERKDLFVRDDVGGKTKAGIALFARETGLVVHHELNETELQMFPEPHVVNLNTRDGAHAVDQHGVVIVETDRVKDGALAWSKKYGDVVGTPMTVDLVGISTTPGTGASTGSVAYFDKLVAHELLHTVSVPHHGDKDYKISMHLKRTPSGRYVLRNAGTDNLYRLYNENGMEVSQALGEELEGKFQEAGYRSFWDSEVTSEEGHFLADLIVGAPGGQHSGQEDCLMRYEFAKAYEQKDRSDAFYFIEEQSRGGALCKRRDGTGVNDEARTPQSRHGAATHGNCGSRVCVNDRYGTKR